MIIKGGSRAAPGQLAWHLQRRDTNERIEILELQSLTQTLGQAFRDWQTLTEGTRGTKGLYHANIDPAKDYTMTREQWQRAVEVLERELGLERQPRAVILHEKHGREHIHVVWARTDIDRMVLRSDSQNYLAHERASKKLEEEFGHEPVPGKHAKRDREKEPEFPSAEANQAEWQQAERTGLDLTARKDQITALRQASDSGQAFKTALEDNGYILAKGDRRDFVIVDEAGSIHSLARQIRDMKAAELRAFMKDIDREKLPTAEEAVALQEQRSQEQQREKYHELERQPEQQQPQQAQQLESPHQPDHRDDEEQLRRQHQAPEPPYQQEPQEPQRHSESQRPETPRRYPDQPNVDGLGAIIEVAVTPLTEALRAAFELGRARERGDEPQQREAPPAYRPQRYPHQPDVDGLGAILEVAVTPLTEALRAAFELGRTPEQNEERQKWATSAANRPRRPPNQPDVDGLGVFLELLVTPLTEALTAAFELGCTPERSEERQQWPASPVDGPRRPPNQPNVDGLGVILELAVTPLTEALRAAFELGRSRERNEELQQQQEQKQPQQSREQEAPPQPQPQQHEPQPEQREEEQQQEHVQQQHQDEREEREDVHQEGQPQQQDFHQNDAEQETRESSHADLPSLATQDHLDPEKEALKAAVAKQQAEERACVIESQTAEMKELRQTLAHDTEEKLERFDAIQREQAETRDAREQEQAPTGIARFVTAMQDILFPERAAQREEERRRLDEEFARRQQQEREDYAAQLKEANDLEIENVTERHAFRLEDQATRGQEDLERYLRELEAARELQAELEERVRQRTEERARDGPERLPPRRAR